MTFCVIEIETKRGEIYRIPSMPVTSMEDLLGHLERFGRISFSELTLVTQDKACLVIPWRIVGVIRVDGEEKWRCLV